MGTATLTRTDAGTRTLLVGTSQGVLTAADDGNGAYATRSLGPAGRGNVAVLVDARDGRTLYAGSDRHGMLRSRDGGATWQEINRGITYKNIVSLEQHPRTGTLFAGTEPSSIFRSDDEGETWQDCEHLRGLPSTKYWSFPLAPYVSHIKHIGLCADDPETVFAAVEEGWLIRSRDGGKTWDNLRQGVDYDSHSVLLMPDNPQVVIATSGYGLYRSEDGGESFTRITDGLDKRYFAPCYVHPDRPNRVFTAAAFHIPLFWRQPEKYPRGADGAVYRSQDQGRAWTRLSGGLPDPMIGGPMRIGGDPSDAEVVVVGMTDGSVWLSENGGEAWRQVLTGLGSIRSASVLPR